MTFSMLFVYTLSNWTIIWCGWFFKIHGTEINENTEHNLLDNANYRFHRLRRKLRGLHSFMDIFSDYKIIIQ